MADIYIKPGGETTRSEQEYAKSLEESVPEHQRGKKVQETIEKHRGGSTSDKQKEKKKLKPKPETKSFWQKKGYSEKEAGQIATYASREKRTPTPEKIKDIIRSEPKQKIPQFGDQLTTEEKIQRGRERFEQLRQKGIQEFAREKGIPQPETETQKATIQRLMEQKQLEKGGLTREERRKGILGSQRIQDIQAKEKAEKQIEQLKEQKTSLEEQRARIKQTEPGTTFKTKAGEEITRKQALSRLEKNLSQIKQAKGRATEVKEKEAKQARILGKVRESIETGTGKTTETKIREMSVPEKMGLGVATVADESISAPFLASFAAGGKGIEQPMDYLKREYRKLSKKPDITPSFIAEHPQRAAQFFGREAWEAKFSVPGLIALGYATGPGMAGLSRIGSFASSGGKVLGAIGSSTRATALGTGGLMLTKGGMVSVEEIEKGEYGKTLARGLSIGAFATGAGLGYKATKQYLEPQVNVKAEPRTGGLQKGQKAIMQTVAGKRAAGFDITVTQRSLIPGKGPYTYTGKGYFGAATKVSGKQFRGKGEYGYLIEKGGQKVMVRDMPFTFKGTSKLNKISDTLGKYTIRSKISSLDLRSSLSFTQKVKRSLISHSKGSKYVGRRDLSIKLKPVSKKLQAFSEVMLKKRTPFFRRTESLNLQLSETGARGVSEGRSLILNAKKLPLMSVKKVFKQKPYSMKNLLQGEGGQKYLTSLKKTATEIYGKGTGQATTKLTSKLVTQDISSSFSQAVGAGQVTVSGLFAEQGERDQIAQETEATEQVTQPSVSQSYTEVKTETEPGVVVEETTEEAVISKEDVKSGVRETTRQTERIRQRPQLKRKTGSTQFEKQGTTLGQIPAIKQTPAFGQLPAMKAMQEQKTKQQLQQKQTAFTTPMVTTTTPPTTISGFGVPSIDIRGKIKTGGRELKTPSGDRGKKPSGLKLDPISASLSKWRTGEATTPASEKAKREYAGPYSTFKGFKSVEERTGKFEFKPFNNKRKEVKFV